MLIFPFFARATIVLLIIRGGTLEQRYFGESQFKLAATSKEEEEKLGAPATCMLRSTVKTRVMTWKL
jgi:hypothetical protein